MIRYGVPIKADSGMGGVAFIVPSVKAVGAGKDPIISRNSFFTSFLTQGKHETSNLRVIKTLDYQNTALPFVLL
jgi:hypothetical protein